MPLLKTQAIVGSAFDLGDKDLVVHLLAPEYGRLGVVIRGGKASAKGRAGVFQPLAEVEVTAYLREGKDLATLKEAVETDSHAGLRSDLNRLALASYLFDLAIASAMPGPEVGETFDLLRRALGHLEVAGERPPLTALCHWFLRFLAVHGVEPSIDEALLSGAWKGSDAARKPKRYLLYISEGVIAAAPGEPGGRVPSSEDRHAAGAAGAGPSRKSDYSGEASKTERRAGGPSTMGPLAYALEPAAVRAVYDNQRTPVESITDLPPIAALASAGLLRALAALAIHHLDVHPRSWRFLETTVLKRTSETWAKR